MTKYKYNKEALWSGREFVNYRDFVNSMGWSFAKSGSPVHQLQFKRLSELCRWSKDLDENGKRLSNKIIIHEVYEKPIPSVDKRSTSPSRITHFPGYCIPEEHD